MRHETVFSSLKRYPKSIFCVQYYSLKTNFLQFQMHMITQLRKTQACLLWRRDLIFGMGGKTSLCLFLITNPPFGWRPDETTTQPTATLSGMETFVSTVHQGCKYSFLDSKWKASKPLSLRKCHNVRRSQLTTEACLTHFNPKFCNR